MPTPSLVPALPKPLKISNPGGIDPKPPSRPNPDNDARQDRQQARQNGGGRVRIPAGKPYSTTKTPVTGSFGLNLGDNTPFNIFGMPRTQGAFNKEVLGLAQPQFQPQLQAVAGQETAENTATGERTGDIGSIYNQYQKQAQDAFNETKQALNELAVANAGSDTAGQANLKAALSSAGGAGSSVDAMMGINPASGETTPYVSAGDAATSAEDQLRAGSAAGTLTIPSANLADVGMERATELNTESLRHGAAIQGLENQKSSIEQQIPGIIATARQNLINDLLNAKDLRFQQGLADRQFGLSKQAQGFNQAQTKANFRETQLNDASNRKAQAAQIRQNAQALVNQRNAINTAAATAIAKAQGTQQANAIKYLQSWLAPTKNEMTTKSILGSDGSTRHVTVLADPKQWHRDVGSALRVLMDQYGLSQDQALQMMQDIGANTYVSGQGGETIAGWARTFKQRNLQNQAVQRLGGQPTYSPSGGFRIPGGGTLTKKFPRITLPQTRG